jgi:hypothetical protein
MMFNPRTKDPLTSNLIGLLKRADVYAELRISSKQREQLEAMEKGVAEELPARMIQSIRSNMPDFGAMRDLPAEERRDKMTAFREQIRNNTQNAMQGFYGEIEKKLSEILSTAQLKRLKELDLQWRGPLSIGDKKVAEPFELNDEQKPLVQEIVGELRQKQEEIRGKAMQDLFQRNNQPTPNGGQPNASPRGGAGGASRGTGAGATGNVQSSSQDGVVIIERAEIQTEGTPGGGGRGTGRGQGGGRGRGGQGGGNAGPGGGFAFQMPDPKEMEAAMQKSQEELEKLFKPLEERMLALLLPSQKDTWRKMQGVKFTFRKNL